MNKFEKETLEMFKDQINEMIENGVSAEKMNDFSLGFAGGYISATKDFGANISQELSNAIIEFADSLIS